MLFERLLLLHNYHNYHNLNTKYARCEKKYALSVPKNFEPLCHSLVFDNAKRRRKYTRTSSYIIEIFPSITPFSNLIDNSNN